MIDGYKDSDYIGIIKELCPELETLRQARSNQAPAKGCAHHHDAEHPKGLLAVGGAARAWRTACR